MKEVILTGIRSNDEPTIGNYLGGMLPMVKLQQHYGSDYQINMFVPDLHSFTTPIDHSILYRNTFKNLKYFIAAGLDITNENTYLYRQSFIPQHSELAWILACFTSVGEMRRMTQFKDKSAGDEGSVSVGLFSYPVLMAADILLYNSRWVPVGDDQRQHLEITRDIAIRMNHKFGEDLFTVPESWEKQLSFSARDNGLRIRSLANPEKKMSKSVNDPRGTILLNDDPLDAAKKVMAATTDSLGNIRYDWQQQPGITNLLQLLSLLSGTPQQETNATWEGNDRYGDFKQTVAGHVETFLRDFQDNYRSIDESAVLSKLEASESAMIKTAEETIHRVQRAVGLRSR